MMRTWSGTRRKIFEARHECPPKCLAGADCRQMDPGRRAAAMPHALRCETNKFGICRIKWTGSSPLKKQPTCGSYETAWSAAGLPAAGRRFARAGIRPARKPTPATRDPGRLWRTLDPALFAVQARSRTATPAAARPSRASSPARGGSDPRASKVSTHCDTWSRQESAWSMTAGLAASSPHGSRQSGLPRHAVRFIGGISTTPAEPLRVWKARKTRSIRSDPAPSRSCDQIIGRLLN